MAQEVTVTATRPTGLYRAVNDDELLEMMFNGMNFVPSKDGLEVKYFWPDARYAFAFANEYIKQGWVDTSMHILYAPLPPNLDYSTINVSDLSKYNLGNVYAITVSNANLRNIGPASIIGYVPK